MNIPGDVVDVVVNGKRITCCKECPYHGATCRHANGEGVLLTYPTCGRGFPEKCPLRAEGIVQIHQIPPKEDSDLCPECRGRRYIMRLDIMAGAQVKAKCPKCEGKGKLKKVVDGVRLRALVGETFIAEKVYLGQVVSSMRLFCWRVVRDKPLMIADIVRMYTNDKQQRKGHMTDIMRGIMGIKFFAGIRTSWTASTESGRHFLLKHGFQRNGQLLTWENPNAKHAIGRIREIIAGAPVESGDATGQPGGQQGDNVPTEALPKVDNAQREPHREGAERASEAGAGRPETAPGVPGPDVRGQEDAADGSGERGRSGEPEGDKPC